MLWRLDQPTRDDIELYVVSPVPPDFTGLIEQAGWPTAPAWDTTPYSPFLDRVTTGQEWRFRLTANPTHSAGRNGSEGGRRGRVKPHVTLGHQQEWLESHAARWGFRIPQNSLEAAQLQLSERTTDRFARRGADEPVVAGGISAARVSITRVSYSGKLVVVDAQALRSALAQGMGRAKAYGCGLMTLARS